MTAVVVGAVIVDSFALPRRVLGARKATGADAGSWEFPGGKVEPGESAEDALRREIREELGVDIVVHEPIGRWPIDARTELLLIAAECDGSATVGPDHSEVRWFEAAELPDVRWLAADELALPAVGAILRA
ncbi:MAG TPA: NUDIX domain-containing protein [Aeromicrobium sp.]|nr:NUDIX domain-containing protein [Aeromicrobium sp.]